MKKDKNKVKRQKDGFFKRHYSLSWKYIKECRSYILFIVLVFLFAFLIALYYQPLFIVDWIKEFVKELLEETSDLNMWQMIVFILNNNLRSSFIAMLLGIFLGIFPVVTALANGYVLGFIVEKTVEIEGFSILWRLLPHGIFEIPAVFLALALGTKLGFFWLAKDKKKEFFRRLEQSLRVFLFIILPLLIIAAIIEGILIFALG